MCDFVSINSIGCTAEFILHIIFLYSCNVILFCFTLSVQYLVFIACIFYILLYYLYTLGVAQLLLTVCRRCVILTYIHQLPSEDPYQLFSISYNIFVFVKFGFNPANVNLDNL